MHFIPTPVQIYARRTVGLKSKLVRRQHKVDFWTEEEIATLFELYNRGEKVKDIAVEIGRSKAAVTTKLYKILHDQELIAEVTAPLISKPQKSKK